MKPGDIAPQETIDDLLDGRLRIIQAKHGYRFSLDPVLLCHFAAIPARAKVVDLGTGCGVIPMVLAARGKGGEFLGIERQAEMADRARRSVALNGLQDCVTIMHGDIRSLPGEVPSGTYDAVVSNPPYRAPHAGRVAPGQERAESRHELAGDIADFVASAALLLKNGGRLFMVYLAERLAELLVEMKAAQLEPKRLRMVHPRTGDAASLVLLEGRKNGRPSLKVEPPLFIYQGPGRDYTSEVLAMYQG